MFRNRCLLTLVVALSFSTLAAADSLPAGLRLFHAGAGVTSAAHSNAPFSGQIISGQIMLMPIVTRPSGGISVAAGMHNNHRLRTGNWDGAGHGQAMSTPEPGGLMLLSTGLIGMAGMVRRKLARG